MSAGRTTARYLARIRRRCVVSVSWSMPSERATAGIPHPEHAGVREWLELAHGETLDPHAFDRAAVSRRLAVLRRR